MSGSLNLYFTQIVDLPKISSRSFRGGKDTSGNFIFMWDPPADIEFWNANTENFDVRAVLGIYDGGVKIGDIFIRGIPPHLGFVTIPYDVMQAAEAKGDFFEIGLQFRTTDNQNRFYPNKVSLERLPREKRKAIAVVPLF